MMTSHARSPKLIQRDGHAIYREYYGTSPCGIRFCFYSPHPGAIASGTGHVGAGAGLLRSWRPTHPYFRSPPFTSVIVRSICSIRFRPYKRGEARGKKNRVNGGFARVVSSSNRRFDASQSRNLRR
jgi:hypothetical protein